MDDHPATKADLAELEARVIRRLRIVAVLIVGLTVMLMAVLP